MLNLFGPHDVLIVSPGTILVRLNKSATISHPIHQKCRGAGFALTFLGGCRVRLSAAIHPFLKCGKAIVTPKLTLHWDAIGEFW